MDESTGKKPHWAWPHVIGVAIAMLAYFVIFKFTGDSDVFYAIAMGAAAWTVAWSYFFPPKFLRKK